MDLTRKVTVIDRDTIRIELSDKDNFIMRATGSRDQWVKYGYHGRELAWMVLGRYWTSESHEVV